MKKFRRWPRIIFALINISAVILLLILVRKEYVKTDQSSISYNESGGIVFGISLIEDPPQTVLSDLKVNNNDTDWSTSFLLQSQSPTVQVYLDYISIYDNAINSQYCFTSFHLGKEFNVPIQVVSEINSSSNVSEIGNSFGELEQVDFQSSEYVFRLADTLCLNKGGKYFLPHLFLGIIPSDTSATFLFDKITGFRAFEFFPFEKQEITFDLSANYIFEENNFNVSPNLDVSISQQGWIGVFNNTGEKIVLSLSRPMFYQLIVIIFSAIMAVLILLLNNIIDVDDGFFEVSFGLLLGLWGTHEILIPAYIDSSIPIDIIIYILYVLVISEIVAVVVDEYVLNVKKQNVRITRIVRGDLVEECIVIKNPSLFPIDMTGWILSDRAFNKFKFPMFVLGGKKEVKIWTKSGVNNFNELYWGRRQEVWNNDEETAYLEDSRGNAIDNHSYDRRQQEN